MIWKLSGFQGNMPYFCDHAPSISYHKMFFHSSVKYFASKGNASKKGQINFSTWRFKERKGQQWLLKNISMSQKPDSSPFISSMLLLHRENYFTLITITQSQHGASQLTTGYEGVKDKMRSTSHKTLRSEGKIWGGKKKQLILKWTVPIISWDWDNYSLCMSHYTG